MLIPSYFLFQINIDEATDPKKLPPEGETLKTLTCPCHSVLAVCFFFFYVDMVLYHLYFIPVLDCKVKIGTRDA